MFIYALQIKATQAIVEGRFFKETIKLSVMMIKKIHVINKCFCSPFQAAG